MNGQNSINNDDNWYWELVNELRRFILAEYGEIEIKENTQ